MSIPDLPENILDSYYILVDGIPQKAKNMNEWISFMSSKEKWSIKTVVRDENGTPILISTVFLGLDHSFSIFNVSKPLVFETCKFVGSDYSEVVKRYYTKEEAEKGHKEFCRTFSGPHGALTATHVGFIENIESGDNHE